MVSRLSVFVMRATPVQSDVHLHALDLYLKQVELNLFNAFPKQCSANTSSGVQSFTTSELLTFYVVYLNVIFFLIDANTELCKYLNLS